MKRQKKYITVYCIGSLGYSAIEVLWRGYTHWTMGIVGGISFILLHFINCNLERHSHLIKCMIGSLTITSIEFASGCIFNFALHMNVWDYSNQPGNILGQICPLYCLYWFLLCIPTMAFSSLIQKQIFAVSASCFPSTNKPGFSNHS